MQPVACSHSFTADTTGGTQPEDIFQDPLSSSPKVFAFRNSHR